MKQLCGNAETVVARFALLALPFALTFCASSASAQTSLSTAVNLGLQNSPRVKLAQTDLTRAKAVLAESRDVFVPAISANAGVGREVGAPLSPPVVFRIDAQSLVYSFSQPDYIRAARSGVTSAQLALDAVRLDVSEEIVNTYLALDNAQRRRDAQSEAFSAASRLADIVQDRFAAGVDPHIELTRAKRTSAQIHLQALQVEDEIAANQEHLAVLTGLPASGWKTVPESIPALPSPGARNAAAQDDPKQYSGLSAAFATAIARRYTAFGDQKVLLRPQITFSANYSRLEDAFTSYDQYYPGFAGVAAGNGHPAIPNSFNSLSAGIQITLPLVDMVRRARTRESAADATHAFFEAQIQQATFIEGREKLRHSAAELLARSALSALDHDLAQDELDAVLLRLQAVTGAAGGTQASPKDEQNARLAERQRTVDMLNAELQLHQAEVMLLRQEGGLGRYLELAIPNATSVPSGGVPTIEVPAVNRPTVPTQGAEPVPTTPASPATPTSAPSAGVPTNGTAPSSLPSAPASTPAPATVPSTAPATPHP